MALLWLGSLVTTYKAAGAIPDWPTTFGYWVYPPGPWLAALADLGRWNLFLQQTHRYVAWLAVVGSLVLAALLWRHGHRRGMDVLAVAVVVGACLQALLGGLRVLANHWLLAVLHGCTALGYFVFATTVVTVTSPSWQQAGPAASVPDSSSRRIAVGLCFLLAAQIFFGSQLRHAPPDPDLPWLLVWIWIKVISAGVIFFAIGWLWFCLRPLAATLPTLWRRGWWVAILYFVQLGVGAALWVASYGWPAWFQEYCCPIGYTVVALGWLRVNLAAAHLLLAGLTLAAAVNLTLWARRLASSAPLNPEHPAR
jgi:heme A synthase